MGDGTGGCGRKGRKAPLRGLSLGIWNYQREVLGVLLKVDEQVGIQSLRLWLRVIPECAAADGV